MFCSATGSPASGTQNLKKRAVSFLSGSQDGKDVSTLPSPSPFASRQQGPVREHDASRTPCPTVPLHCPTAGASVVPLVHLVQSLGAWLALPDGLAGSREPSDSAMRFSSPGALLSPGAFASPLCWTRMLRSCVAVLLAKDAIQPVPPAEMRAGFYSPYFIVSKKGGELRPILDLCVLNQALHNLPFRMLTQKRIFQCICPFDWFTAIDLKDAYFHVSILPRHRPFLHFAFEGRAYQYKFLPSDLQPMVGSCFSSGRSSPSASVQACCCINGCLCHGLGSHVQRACSCGALDRAPTAVAYQLPRSMACSAPLQIAATRQAGTGPYGQHCDRCVQGGLCSRRMSQLARDLVL